MSARRELGPTIQASASFHEELFPLWSSLPEPTSPRGLVAAGFCLLTRQHVLSQFQLASVGLDVSAITLVRPAFEALVRSIWVVGGAGDKWIEGFLTPTEAAVSSDAETLKGPPIDSMLATIRLHHPQHIADGLALLKERTWRGMNSYVHGGIRAFVHVMVEVPEHEVAGALMNANAMLLMATNVVRMSCGVSSPELPALQKRHAVCLPPV